MNLIKDGWKGVERRSGKGVIFPRDIKSIPPPPGGIWHRNKVYSTPKRSKLWICVQSNTEKKYVFLYPKVVGGMMLLNPGPGPRQDHEGWLDRVYTQPFTSRQHSITTALFFVSQSVPIHLAPSILGFDTPWWLFQRWWRARNMDNSCWLTSSGAHKGFWPGGSNI